MYKCVYRLEYIYSNNDNIKEENMQENFSFFFVCLIVGSRRRRISKHVLPGEVFQGIYTGALAYTYARTQTHIYATSSSVPNL